VAAVAAVLEQQEVTALLEQGATAVTVLPLASPARRLLALAVVVAGLVPWAAVALVALAAAVMAATTAEPQTLGAAVVGRRIMGPPVLAAPVS
jgi:hypothetical protein